MIATETSGAARGTQLRSRIVVLDAPEIVDLVRELIDSGAIATARDASVVGLGSAITFEDVAASNPELVIIDPRFMPGTSGWELVGRLQADARTNHLPIIVCSSNSGDGHGADGHVQPSSGIRSLNKPFTLDDFESALSVLDVPYPATLRRRRDDGTSSSPTPL